MKEIKAFFVVNAKEFMRDRMALILVLALPIAFVGFFGLIFNGGMTPGPCNWAS
jgi:hypothetical protein